MRGDVDFLGSDDMSITNCPGAQYRCIGPQGGASGGVQQFGNGVKASRQGTRIQVSTDQLYAKLVHLICRNRRAARFADNADKVPIGHTPRQGNIRNNLPGQKSIAVPRTLQHRPIGQAIAARGCLIQLLPFGQGQLAHGDLIRRCRKSVRD